VAVAGGYVQFAVETTPNGELNPSAVSSTPFYHPVTQVQWGVPLLLDDRTDELRGVSDNQQKDVMGYDPQTIAINARAYPNILGLHLWATHGAGVFTAGNGVITDPDGTVIPAGANRWVWTAGTNNGPCRSLQAQVTYPDQNLFLIKKGIVWEQLAMSHNGENAELAATGHNLYTARQADPSLTAAYDATATKPLLRSMIPQPGTLLASTGTQSDFGWTLDNPLSFDRTLSGSRFPDVVDRTGVDLNMTLQVKYRNLTDTDVSAFFNGTSFTVKQKWVHTQFITGSYPYKLFIEGNAIYTDLQADALMHKIRNGDTVTVDCGRPTGNTPSYTITLVNGVSSYSSVG
jgi:hypothetical protein